MQKLTRDDLYSLEQYAEKRLDFRAQVLAHKKHRKVHVGPVATLYFEDRMTMQYQIQEMLRVERIFEASGIEEELEPREGYRGDAYADECLEEIPKTLREATDALDGSKMLRQAFGDAVVDHYVHTARWEQYEADRRVTDWELKRGFERY